VRELSNRKDEHGNIDEMVGVLSMTMPGQHHDELPARIAPHPSIAE
jgi:hypothetical protein